MARFLKPVPEEVAQQALTNKTLNAEQLAEAARRGSPDLDEDDLILLAADIAAPELLPYEYAYTDLYTDGEGNFFVAIKERFYRRSVQRTLQP